MALSHGEPRNARLSPAPLSPPPSAAPPGRAHRTAEGGNAPGGPSFPHFRPHFRLLAASHWLRRHPPLLPPSRRVPLATRTGRCRRLGGRVGEPRPFRRAVPRQRPARVWCSAAPAPRKRPRGSPRKPRNDPTPRGSGHGERPAGRSEGVRGAFRGSPASPMPLGLCLLKKSSS